MKLFTPSLSWYVGFDWNAVLIRPLESLSRRRFCQRGRQPEVNRAVIDGQWWRHPFLFEINNGSHSTFTFVISNENGWRHHSPSIMTRFTSGWCPCWQEHCLLKLFINLWHRRASAFKLACHRHPTLDIITSVYKGNRLKFSQINQTSQDTSNKYTKVSSTETGNWLPGTMKFLDSEKLEIPGLRILIKIFSKTFYIEID